MEFKSCINPHTQHKFAEGGFKETIDIYEDIINDKTGEVETKKTKTENFYEKIQEMKEMQTLDNILKRYNIDLNDQHITEINDEIIDMTQIPNDLIETFALTQKLKNTYESATADIKKKFGDFAGFLRSIQNGNIQSELQALTKKQLAVKQQEQAKQVVPSEVAAQAQQVQQTQPAQQNQGGIIYG